MTRHLRTSFLVGALALFLGTVSSDGLAGAERLGIQRTPNGYRVPVYGMSFTRNAEGTLGTECARLTAPPRGVGMACASGNVYSYAGANTAADYEVDEFYAELGCDPEY